MRFSTKILSGFIAVNVLLVGLAAVILFALPPLDGKTATLFMAGGLALVLLSCFVSALIIKSMSLPLKCLMRHLESEARNLEAAAGRLNGTAQAMLDNAGRCSLSLEEAAHSLSQSSALILRGAGTLPEAREVLDQISRLLSQAGLALSDIDANLCLNLSASSDISAEAAQLSGKADELIMAVNELSGIVDGSLAEVLRDEAFSGKSARQALVKALPVTNL